jgi:hypothetical protein
MTAIEPTTDFWSPVSLFMRELVGTVGGVRRSVIPNFALSTFIVPARSFVILKLLMRIQHLKNTFIQNYCSRVDIHQTFNLKQKQRQKPARVAILPFMQGTSDRISWLLASFSLGTVHIPAKYSFNLVGLVRDLLGLSVQVYTASSPVTVAKCRWGKGAAPLS